MRHRAATKQSKSDYGEGGLIDNVRPVITSMQNVKSQIDKQVKLIEQQIKELKND